MRPLRAADAPARPRYPRIAAAVRLLIGAAPLAFASVAAADASVPAPPPPRTDGKPAPAPPPIRPGGVKPAPHPAPPPRVREPKILGELGSHVAPAATRLADLVLHPHAPHEPCFAHDGEDA